MDTRHLQHIYQQWSNGQNGEAKNRWVDFVELASRSTGMSGDAVMRILQTQQWFEWRREE